MAEAAIIKFWSERRYAIVGTILVHMLALIIFLFTQVDKAQKEQETIAYIDVKVLEEAQKIEISKPEFGRRELSPTRRQARNIAVNQTEDHIEKYDDYTTYEVPNNRISNKSAKREADKLVNQSVKDIIKENNLNPDDKELPQVETKPTGFYKAEKIQEEQVYKGPTNIYYKLDNRKVAYLPIPVYKCKGGATVQVDIRVSQRGKVEWTTINNSGTDTQDPCFLDSAKDAAKRTRFNFSSSESNLQQGYIIYHFVAQ